MKSFILLAVSVILISTNSFAVICTSLGNGAWENPLNWSCGAVPAAGDTIVISAGDIVTINSTHILSGAPIVLYIDGVLLFNSPSAKLHLECGSEIHISSTGSIASSGIGTPSHNIKICGELVWEGNDGVLTGPIIISDPLPIELTYFDVDNDFGNLLFSWETASEYNNSHFTVFGSKDGFDWNELLEVNGAGNSSLPISYNAEYNNRSSQFKYFKLKQTDFDGKSSFSSIISIEVSSFNEFTVYPNPLNESTFKIEMDQIDDYKIEIYSVSGRLLQSNELIQSNEIWLESSEFESGMLMILISNSADERITKQLMKL